MHFPKLVTPSLVILLEFPATLWAPPPAARLGLYPGAFPLPSSARARLRDAQGAPVATAVRVAVTPASAGASALPSRPIPKVFSGSAIDSEQSTEWLQNARLRIGEIGDKDWETTLAVALEEGRVVSMNSLRAEVINLRIQAAGPSWTKPSSNVKDATGSYRSGDAEGQEQLPARSFAEVYRDAFTTLVKQNIVPETAKDPDAIAEAIMVSIQAAASSGGEFSTDVQKAMMIATAYLNETGGGEEKPNGEVARAFAAVSARTGGANFRVVGPNLNFSVEELYYLDKVQAKSWSAHITRASGDEILDVAIEAWTQKMAAATDISHVNRDLPFNWAVVADHLVNNLAVETADGALASAVRYTTSLGNEITAIRSPDGGWDGQAVNEIVKDLAAALYGSGSYHISNLDELNEAHKLPGITGEIANELIDLAANPNSQGPVTLNTKPVNMSEVSDPFLVEGQGVGSLPLRTAGFLKNAMGLELATNAQVVGFLSLVSPDLAFSVSHASTAGTPAEAAMKAAVWNTMPASDGVGIASRFMLSDDFIDAAAKVSMNMNIDPDGEFSGTSLSSRDQSCARMIAREISAENPNLVSLSALVANADNPMQVMSEVKIRNPASSAQALEAFQIGEAAASSNFDRAGFVRQMTPSNQLLYNQHQQSADLGPGDLVGLIDLLSSPSFEMPPGPAVVGEIGRTRDGKTAFAIYPSDRGWPAAGTGAAAAADAVGIVLVAGDGDSAQFVPKDQIDDWLTETSFTSKEEVHINADDGGLTGMNLAPDAHVVLLFGDGRQRVMTGDVFRATVSGRSGGETGERFGGDPEPDPDPEPEGPEGL